MRNPNDPIGSGVIKTDADGLVMTQSLRAAEINALPLRVKQYIHDLETNADPAGTIQDLASTKEQLDGTIALLEETENCLEFLLALKDQKDKSGKTDYYLAQMPNAWAWARRILGPKYRGFKEKLGG